MVDVRSDRQLLSRVCDRLRSASEPQLVRDRPELAGASIAVTVHRLCVWAAQAQGEPAEVPVLHPFASGDQLSVIGREFLAWVEQHDDADALATWRADVQRLRGVV